MSPAPERRPDVPERPISLTWAHGDRTVIDEARARLAAGDYPDADDTPSPTRHAPATRTRGEDQ